MLLQPKAREVSEFSPVSESRRRIEFKPIWRERVLDKKMEVEK